MKMSNKLYINSKEYKKRRDNKLLKHALKRKNKIKSNAGHAQKDKVVSNPRELKIFDSNFRFNSGNVVVPFPNVFSFVDNYYETLNFIEYVSALLRTDYDIKLTFLANNLQKMDILAPALLKIILNSAILKFKQNRQNFSINGDYPNDIIAIHKFYSTIIKNSVLDNGFLLDSVVIDPNATLMQTNDETRRILDFYDKCLNANGYCLNDNGIIFLSKLINEIVDNAIQHNKYKKKKPLYFTGGYYNPRTQLGELCIVSLGYSIYDTMHGESTLSSIKNTVLDRIKRQKSIFNLTYFEEATWTIAALQPGISCLRTADNDRGTGLVKFIESCMDIGNTLDERKPIMSIISGHTKIVFDGKYVLKYSENEKTDVIAFNDDNDLNKCPDPAYVSELSKAFPGVAVNVQFYFDKNYLKRLCEDGKQ